MSNPAEDIPDDVGPEDLPGDDVEATMDDDPPYFHNPDDYPTPTGPDEHTHDPIELGEQ